MEKMCQKLKDLNAIQKAASKVEDESAPPLQYPSVIIAGVVTIGVCAGTQSLILGSLAGLLSAWGFQKFGPLPVMTWGEALDNLFTKYEPVDADAYANLHETTRSTLKLEPSAVYDWVKREKVAILANKNR